MNELNRLKEWRAKEIVKIFLLRSNLNFEIVKFDNPIYDFFLKCEKDENVSFAIEVKTKRDIKSRLENQIKNLNKFEELGLITIPVILIIIDDEKETGELDFLIYPSVEKEKLKINTEFSFVELNTENFYQKVDVVKNWFKSKLNHTLVEQMS